MNLSSLVICTPTSGGQYVLSLDGQTVTDSSLKVGIAKLLSGQRITVSSLKAYRPTYNRDLLLGILGEKVENPPEEVLPDASYYDSGMPSGHGANSQGDKSHVDNEKSAYPIGETARLGQNGAVTFSGKRLYHKKTDPEDSLTVRIKQLSKEHMSARNIAKVLQAEGIEISHMTVARRLQGQEVLM